MIAQRLSGDSARPQPSESSTGVSSAASKRRSQVCTSAPAGPKPSRNSITLPSVDRSSGNEPSSQLNERSLASLFTLPNMRERMMPLVASTRPFESTSIKRRLPAVPYTRRCSPLIESAWICRLTFS